MNVAAWILAAATAFEIAGRFHARSWRMDPSEEFHEQSALAVLDIGIVLPTEIRA
jgi:hypothetical protein